MSDVARTQEHEHEYLNPWVVAFAVSIATFMEVLDTTITNVSLAHISGDLGATYEEATWVLTSYLVSNGIIIPLSGWLANVFGRKRYFMMSIGLFTLASLACGMATSLPMLVCFRLLQGLAGGGLQPIQQAIILDAFPAVKRPLAFSVTAITTVAAPILGPTLGGWITDSFSWRWIFYINIPIGIIALLLVGRVVHEPKGLAHGFKNMDYIGLSLVALGLGSLQIVLDKGQHEDWFSSNFIIFFTFLSALCLVSAIFWLLHRKDAIINLHLLKDRGFSMACVMIFAVGFMLYSSSMLLPLIMQTNLGYTAMLAGLVISPGGIVVLLLMPFSGKIASIVQPRYLIVLGFTAMALGMWYSTHITLYVDHSTIVLMRIAQVVGLPLLFIPIGTIAFTRIARGDNNKASALFSMARNLGGSFGISLVAMFTIRKQQEHHNYLASHVSSFDPAVQGLLAKLQALLLEHTGSVVDAGNMASAVLYKRFMTQVAFLSYHDAFYVLTFLAIGAAVFASFTPRRPAQGPPPITH